MRHLFAVPVALALLASAPAHADDAEDARAVIESQLDAFAADDWSTAFGFASPPIRAMMGSAERFSQMVRQSYTIVWRHREARYLDGKAEGDTAVQIMEFVGEDGRVWRAVYELVRVDDMWRVNGVVAREAKTEAI